MDWVLASDRADVEWLSTVHIVFEVLAFHRVHSLTTNNHSPLCRLSKRVDDDFIYALGACMYIYI